MSSEYLNTDTMSLEDCREWIRLLEEENTQLRAVIVEPLVEAGKLPDSMTVVSTWFLTQAYGYRDAFAEIRKELDRVLAEAKELREETLSTERDLEQLYQDSDRGMRAYERVIIGMAMDRYAPDWHVLESDEDGGR